MNEQQLRLGQFSLETLFLLTTVIAVCCGAFVAHPNLGTAALIVGIPALARTIADVRRCFRAGLTVPLSYKIFSYLESVFVTLVGIFCAIFVLLVGFSFIATIGDFAGWQGQSQSFVFVAMLAASGIIFYVIYWRTLP
jgi:hypothetical protein